uniref:Uncharacterized protein n=1 Tax=Polynucleobacter necessarius subsp. necessarius (strain STIR1) TaxID=452638 RepID=B1XU80_POLNS
MIKDGELSSLSSITLLSSLALPDPINKAGSALPLRTIKLAADMDPALPAKRLSSAMLSAKSSRPVSTPTRTARVASTPVLYRASFF